MPAAKGPLHLKVVQANLRHSRGASAIVQNILGSGEADILLIQEPWVNNGVKGLTHKSGKLIYDTNSHRPRTAILIRNELNFTPLTNYITQDVTAIILRSDGKDNKDKDIVLVSAYFPGEQESREDPPPTEVKNLINYCRAQKLEFIISCDANAHNTSWGSTDINKRGESLQNFLIQEDICVANEGNAPTFVSNGREEVLDLTLCSPEMYPNILDWHVSPETSLSDHNHIRFGIQTTFKKTQKGFTYKNSTDWELYKAVISNNFSKNEEKIWCTQSLNEAALNLELRIHNAHKLATTTQRTKSLDKPWWNPEIKALRELVNETMCIKGKKSAEYKLLRNKYNTTIRKEKRKAWHNHVEELSSFASTAKIFKKLNATKSIGLGLLKTPSGEFTKSNHETAELLLSTHFPDSTILEGSEDISIVKELNTCKSKQKLAAEIFTKDKVIWAVNSFKPFKTAGGDKISPKMIQEALPSILDELVRLFIGSLTLSQIPDNWTKVEVIFIPKPGKNPADPKGYRPISLSSFILKTMERLVDLYVREHLLLHENQFAYRKGKSTELAIHQLVSKLEKAKTHGNAALCASMDIQGAFDNTEFSSIVRALKLKGIDPLITEWINTMLRDRRIKATIGNDSVIIKAAKGCPQGGVISPLLWTIVIDELLEDLNNLGLYTLGYADDVVITIIGNDLITMGELMSRAITRTMRWCEGHGLTINPSKTTLVAFFTPRDKPLPRVTVRNNTIVYSQVMKYLGVTIDHKLSWKTHLHNVLAKASKTFWALKCLIGKNWGLTPSMILDIYKLIVRPTITYASLVWWQIVDTKGGIDLCTKTQRTPCRIASGSVRSCPSAALQLLLGIEPLHLYIKSIAAKAAIRLECLGNSISTQSSSHGTIAKLIPGWEMTTNRTDLLVDKLMFDRLFKISFPEREHYSSNQHIIKNTLRWYTDGSKTNEGTGAGIHGPNYYETLDFDDHATVFQTEVVALSRCADVLIQRGTKGQIIHIHSDSQAALQALASHRIKSKIVLECRNNLNALAVKNRVHIKWIPGHAGIDGNEAADKLARKGSAMKGKCPSPTLPLSQSEHKAKIEAWTTKEALSYWEKLPGLSQSKRLINPSLHAGLTSLRRNDLRLLIGFLTGHFPTRSFLHRIGVSDSPSCRLCGEATETTEHLLLECSRMDSTRFSILGKPTLSTSDVRRTKGADLVVFLRRLEGLLTSE